MPHMCILWAPCPCCTHLSVFSSLSSIFQWNYGTLSQQDAEIHFGMCRYPFCSDLTQNTATIVMCTMSQLSNEKKKKGEKECDLECERSEQQIPLQWCFSAACNKRTLSHLESKPRPALLFKEASRCLIYNQLKMLHNFESVFTAFLFTICLLAHTELRGKGLGCYCGFIHLQLLCVLLFWHFMHP